MANDALFATVVGRQLLSSTERANAGETVAWPGAMAHSLEGERSALPARRAGQQEVGIDRQRGCRSIRSNGQAETYLVDSTSTVTEYGAKL